MRPVHFPEATTVAAKDQPEYLPLPCYVDPGPRGEVVSCWRLSWHERLQVLLTGHVWLTLWSFHEPITPQRIDVFRDQVFNGQKESWLQKVHKRLGSLTKKPSK